VRGVVSLAAALAIPFTLDNGQPFPHRTAILFVTFGVIIFTVVGIGLMLPLVVRWIGLTRLGREEHAGEIQSELDARISALDEVEKRLEKFVEERELPDEVITLLRTRNQSRRQILPSDLSDGLEQTRQSVALKKELIDAERDFIYQLLREGKITDEARRRIEYELDLEEAGVANRGKDGGGWF
jgi:CPA1 family monovalent cation:H+ antiporter